MKLVKSDKVLMGPGQATLDVLGQFTATNSDKDVYRRSSLCRGSTRTFIALQGSVQAVEIADFPCGLGKRIPSKVQ